MPFDAATTPTSTQMFTTLQQKATQHTQQPDAITTQTVGPPVQAWQIVEQVQTNEQDKEEYERNNFEFKSWKGTIRYPEPPLSLWQSNQEDLMQIYQASNVPAVPEFEHPYLAALFTSIGPSVFDQIDKVRFYASEQEAIWLCDAQKDQILQRWRQCGVSAINSITEPKQVLCGRS